MSQWRCKLEEGELGPMSFAELAELVRAGTVSEGTRVARVGSSNWEPAWHVPGLLRAGGITEPGDSPPVEANREALTPTLSQREREAVSEISALPGYAPREREKCVAPALSPRERLILLVRGLVATGVGLLAVGFFYRWAYQSSLAFPMPAHEVDGDLINCYFPLVGRCTSFECGLLYFDLFAVAALATWHALRRPLPAAE